MTLPLFLSVPHAGLDIPDELVEYNQLAAEDIAADGDVGAAEIYSMRDDVVGLITTSTARAFVDLNRSLDDRRRDGVVKTHTCWNVPVYRETPPESVFAAVLARVHVPYHAALSRPPARALVAVDCHTMAAFGPPVGPDPGVERPLACLGIVDGTCPRPWALALQRELAQRLEGRVTINDPFAGGYITRSHAREMPWIQLELSRSDVFTAAEKRERVLAALTAWCSASDGPRRT